MSGIIRISIYKFIHPLKGFVIASKEMESIMPTSAILYDSIFLDNLLEVLIGIFYHTTLEVDFSSHKVDIWIILIHGYTIIVVFKSRIIISREFPAPSSGIIAICSGRIFINKGIQVIDGFSILSCAAVDMSFHTLVISRSAILAYLNAPRHISQRFLCHSHP